MRRRHVAAAVAASLLVAGCTGDPQPSNSPDPVLSVEVPTGTFAPTPTPTPTPTPSATTAPTTATPTPTAAVDWTVPDPITSEYVTRVLNELHRLEVPVYQQMADEIAQGNNLDYETMLEQFRTTRSEQHASFEAVNWSSVETAQVVDRFQSPVGATTSTVVSVEDSNEECVVAIGATEPGATLRGDDPYRVIVTLTSSEANATGWIIDNEVGLDSETQAC